MAKEIEQHLRFEFKPNIEITAEEYSSRARVFGSESHLDADIDALRLRAEKMRNAVSELLKQGALRRGEPRTINIGDMIHLPNCTQLVSINEARDGFLEIRYLQVIGDVS